MGWLKLILWTMIGGLTAIGGLLLMITRNWWWGIPFLVTGVWILASIKIIGPDEMAVFVLAGEPIRFRDSGPTFVPWLLAWLARYPKKMYNLDYPGREIVSKEGEYPSEEKEPDPKKRRRYGAQVLIVDSVAYLRFPQDKHLIQILKSKVPIDDMELLKWTEEAVVGALRVALGKITWKEATEDIEGIREKADAIFKARDGVLLRVGFKAEDLRLTIKEIRLPQRLKEILPEVDRQRLEAEAAPFEAAQRAEEIAGAIREMFCKLTRMSPEEVKRALTENPVEFVRKYEALWKEAWDAVYRKMAIDGAAYLDIRTQNPLQDLIALWKRMPMGRRPVTPAPATREEEKKGETFAETLERIKRIREEKKNK